MLADYLNLRSAPFLVYPCGLFLSRLLSLGGGYPGPGVVPGPAADPAGDQVLVQPRYFSYFLPVFLLVTAAGSPGWLPPSLRTAGNRRPC